jgi:transcriptional regulator with XRE-family HTH domain
MEKLAFNRKFGEFVKQKRIRYQWSQLELASRMGNNFQNISRLERGEISPTMFWFHNLTIVFDISMSDMMREFETFYTDGQPAVEQPLS